MRGREREREGEKRGWVSLCERDEAESRRPKRSERTQNEEAIRFTRREATKFVVVEKEPSLLHLVGTRRGL